MLQLHCIRMLFVLHLVCVSKTILKEPISFLLFFTAQTPSFPSGTTNVNSYSRRRSASHSTPNSPTKSSRSRSEAFCTCMTADPTLIGN